MTPEDCRTEIECLEQELHRLLERRAQLLAEAKGLQAERPAAHAGAEAAAAWRSVRILVESQSHPAHHTEVGELP